MQLNYTSIQSITQSPDHPLHNIPVNNVVEKIQLMSPDKVHIFISIMPISSPNPIFDILLESSLRDDSNKRLNRGFGEKIT